MSGDPESLLDPAFLARLERVELVARRVVSGELRGDALARRRGSGALFREHKRYAQGDDLRFVDWNVFSRLGELLVKQFESEENLDLLLVVDASGSMDFGRSSKFRCAQRIAAMLGWIALGRHAGVRLAFLPRAGSGDGRRATLGRGKLPDLLRRLDAARPAGAVDFYEEVVAVASARRARGLAIVVSDFFFENGYEKAFKFLGHQGYRVGAVQVLDALDLRPGLGGRLRLMDMESDRSLKGVVSSSMLAAYEIEVRRWCEGFRTFCRSQNVACATVDSAWDLERCLRALLGAGGLVA